MSSELRPFGTRLRGLRRASRLTQQELAERSGVSTATISDLERGRWQTPRGDTARMLADALGLMGDDRDEFLGIVREQRLPRRRAAWAPTPLPPRSDLLVGREALLAETEAVLAPGALVSLTGPGGVGKTRLALEVAHRALASHEGPVVWVDLASVAAAADLLPAIARAAGVIEQAGVPLRQRLAHALRGRAPLLVLDNLEQLAGAAPDLAALLDAVPDAALLATSRVPLRIAQERRVLVPPLALPPSEADGDAIAAASAVRLFLVRAAARGHDAPPSPAELRAAAAIATIVDGLPLAIEFAAARTDTLAYATVADLLRHAGLGMLEGGPPEAHPRLRSMEQAVAWSHDLLPPAAQRLFRLLAVFRDGFTVGDVSAVAAALGEPALVGELPSLEHASLIRQLPSDGTPRLGMLEPTRMVAERLLAQAGVEARARDAHAAAFTARAREAAAAIPGPRFAEGLATFARERANIAAALGRAVETGDARRAFALAASLVWWWELRSDVSEGRRWLARVTDLDDRDADLLDRLTVRWIALLFATYQNDRADQHRHVAALAAIAEATGEPQARAFERIAAGFAAGHREPGSPEAIRLLGEAADLLTPLGPSVALAWTLGQRSWERRIAGETEAALADIEASIGVWDALGTVVFLAAPHHHHGATLLALGREREARAAFRRALAVARQVGTETAGILVLCALAHVAALDGDREEAETAARLLGAADSAVARHALSLGTMLAQRNAETRRLLAATLGPERLAGLEAEGHARSVPEAISLAASL